jgi:heme/copper-type cytochrome/quinol oxidase subunit 2
MKKQFGQLGLALFALAMLANTALACPGCAASLSTQAGTSAEVVWGRSFCMSIYFMLFVVHVLIGYAFYKVYKVIKAEDVRHQAKN